MSEKRWSEKSGEECLKDMEKVRRTVCPDVGYKVGDRTYMPGMIRSERGKKRKSHLFDGDFKDPGLPMCMFAYDVYGSYSILRNNVSDNGICELCKRRADKGIDGVIFIERKEF